VSQDPEDGGIKSPLTPVGIKSLLINPDIYNYIELTIKLLRTVDHLSHAGVKKAGSIKTLLTLLASEYGPQVLEHLLEHGAYTYGEIEVKLGIPKSTILYITRRLTSIGVLESKAVVLPHNPTSPGGRPIVWVIVGGDPQLSVNCINRYYDLTHHEKLVIEEPAIVYEFSKEGQEMAQIWIEYYTREDRAYLEPSPGDLKQNIRQDAPDIGIKERESIVRHIMQKVREHREAE